MIDLDAFFRSGAIISTSPGKVMLGFGKRVWREEPAGFSFFFPDFFLREAVPLLVHEHTHELSLKDLLLFLGDCPSCPMIKWLPPDRNDFVREFYQLQALFAKRILQKAVPFVFETADGVPSPENLHYFLNHAVTYALNHPVFLYGFWDNHSGMLGATPELLLRMKSGLLETVACASTCATAERDGFLQDKKQRYEHELVVKGIIDALSPFGSVTTGNCHILDLPTLCHLLTPIKLSVTKDVALDKIIKAIHPTPALGAFPKQPGRIWLEGIQKRVDRMRFGAPAGYSLPNGDAKCYVAIRNLQWRQGKMKIGAGCGVVPESVLNREWDEIRLKIQSVKKIFGL